MPWQPPGSTGTGTDPNFPTAAPAVLVSRDYSHNQDQPVPGLGPMQAYTYQQGDSAGAAENAFNQGNPTTMSQALTQLLVLGQTDTNGTRSLQEQMVKAGYLNPDPKRGNFVPGSVASGDTTYNAYEKLLNDAIVTGTSIYDILDHRINDPQNATGQRYWKIYQGVTGQAPIEKIYNLTATNQTSAPDARALAQSEFQQFLGRDPNSKESEALHAALNAYERANPTHITKDVSVDPSMGYGGIQDKNTSTTGGVSQAGAAQFADNFIAQNDAKELGQVQTNRLVNVFEQMLKGGG